MSRKHVHFNFSPTPSPTFSSSSLPSSPGPATPPPLGFGSPYHTTPLPSLTVAHPALAASQTPALNWDMSNPTSTITPRTSLPSDIWIQAATQPAVGSMDVICPRLPWRISVYPRLKGSFVTVADVFDALYWGLRTPVTAGEFNLSLTSERARHSVNDAFHRRCKRQLDFTEQRSEQQSGIRRIDYLGDMSEFGGLVYAKDGWILNISS